MDREIHSLRENRIHKFSLHPGGRKTLFSQLFLMKKDAHVCLSFSKLGLPRAHCDPRQLPLRSCAMETTPCPYRNTVTVLNTTKRTKTASHCGVRQLNLTTPTLSPTASSCWPWRILPPSCPDSGVGAGPLLHVCTTWRSVWAGWCFKWCSLPSLLA